MLGGGAEATERHTVLVLRISSSSVRQVNCRLKFVLKHSADSGAKRRTFTQFGVNFECGGGDFIFSSAAFTIYSAEGRPAQTQTAST